MKKRNYSVIILILAAVIILELMLISEVNLTGNQIRDLNLGEKEYNLQEIQLSTSSQNELYPEIYGNYVVWQSEINGTDQIFLHNIETGNTTQISDPNYPYDNKDPKIEAWKVVWFREGSTHNRGKIVSYDIGTQQIEEIVNVNFYYTSRPFLDLDNGKVVYPKYLSSPDRTNIFRTDLVTKQETQLTFTQELYDQNPFISGNKLAFMRNNFGGYYDVYVKNLDTGVETKLWVNAYSDLEPVVEGDMAFWSGLWAYITDFDLLRRNLSNSDGWEWAVHDYRESRNPDINYQRVVWQDKVNQNWDIFMCDLRFDGTYGGCSRFDQKITISNNTASQTDPDIFRNKVVWQDNRNGNWDIFYTEFPVYCVDGTLSGQCSGYNYCDNGEFKAWCWKCGCPSGWQCKKVGPTPTCVSGTSINPAPSTQQALR